MSTINGSFERKTKHRPLKVLLSCLGTILLVVILIRIASPSGEVSTDQANTPTSQNDESQTITYKPAHIADLIANDQTSQSALVEIEAQVIKKSVFTETGLDGSKTTYYFLEVSENGSRAVVYLKTQSDLDSYSVGETLQIKAASGFFGPCNNTFNKNICNLFGLWRQKDTPALILIEENMITKI